MNIAELFVRVRGDTTDVTRQLKNVEGSMAGVERASLRLESGMTRGHASTGKLRQELVTLVRQATGTAPVIAQLGTVIGEMALGGPIVLGVTLGIAAIVGGYRLLTEGSRKAREENEKFTKSLLDQAAAEYDATVKGAELAKLRADVLLQEAHRARVMGPRSFLESAISGRPIIDTGDAEAASKRIADAQSVVEQATKNVAKAYDAANKPLSTSVTKAGELKEHFQHIVTLAEVIAMPGKWSAMIQALSAATLQQATQSVFGDLIPQNIDMPRIDVPSKEQVKAIRESITHEDQNAELLRNAIFNSAAIIVNALNIGGGGRASGLGGAVGSTAGFAAGFLLGGPVGGTIGSLVGQLGGSLLGGLFDHNSRAVNSNTAATERNTAMMALMLNAPAGFRVGSYAYAATATGGADVEAYATAARRRAARGGTVPV